MVVVRPSSDATQAAAGVRTAASTADSWQAWSEQLEREWLQALNTSQRGRDESRGSDTANAPGTPAPSEDEQAFNSVAGPRERVPAPGAPMGTAGSEASPDNHAGPAAPSATVAVPHQRLAASDRWAAPDVLAAPHRAVVMVPARGSVRGSAADTPRALDAQAPLVPRDSAEALPTARHVHVLIAPQGVSVWLRDTELTGARAARLGRDLAAQLQRDGRPLAQLVVNGQAVYANPSAPPSASPSPPLLLA